MPNQNYYSTKTNENDELREGNHQITLPMINVPEPKNSVKTIKPLFVDS